MPRDGPNSEPIQGRARSARRFAPLEPAPNSGLQAHRGQGGYPSAPSVAAVSGEGVDASPAGPVRRGRSTARARGRGCRTWSGAGGSAGIRWLARGSHARASTSTRPWRQAVCRPRLHGGPPFTAEHGEALSRSRRWMASPLAAGPYSPLAARRFPRKHSRRARRLASGAPAPACCLPGSCSRLCRPILSRPACEKRR